MPVYINITQEYEIEPVLVRGPLPRRVMYYKDDTTKVDDKGKKKEREQLSLMQNLAGVHLVVAVLITTVSYAACINCHAWGIHGWTRLKARLCSS